MQPDPAPAWLSAAIDIDAEPEATWNAGGGFAVVALAGLTRMHVMSRAQAKALKDAFAEVEAMFAEREVPSLRPGRARGDEQ